MKKLVILLLMLFFSCDKFIENMAKPTRTELIQFLLGYRDGALMSGTTVHLETCEKVFRERNSDADPELLDEVWYLFKGRIPERHYHTDEDIQKLEKEILEKNEKINEMIKSAGLNDG